MCVGRGCVCPAWLESTDRLRRISVSLFRFSVVPFLGLEFRLYQRYRMTTIDAQSLRFLFYFISHHNLSRESGNSLDQIQISRESRLP